MIQEQNRVLKEQLADAQVLDVGKIVRFHSLLTVIFDISTT